MKFRQNDWVAVSSTDVKSKDEPHPITAVHGCCENAISTETNETNTSLTHKRSLLVSDKWNLFWNVIICDSNFRKRQGLHDSETNDPRLANDGRQAVVCSSPCSQTGQPGALIDLYNIYIYIRDEKEMRGGWKKQPRSPAVSDLSERNALWWVGRKREGTERVPISLCLFHQHRKRWFGVTIAIGSGCSRCESLASVLCHRCLSPDSDSY